jgi:hypothetical protein
MRFLHGYSSPLACPSLAVELKLCALQIVYCIPSPGCLALVKLSGDVHFKLPTPIQRATIVV